MAQYGWALSDFAGDSANNQLSFSRGDVLLVTHQQEGGWWFGTTHKDGKKGYFPETFVKLHETDDKQKTSAPSAATSATLEASDAPAASVAEVATPTTTSTAATTTATATATG